MRIAFYTATRPGLAGFYNRLVRLVDGSPYSHAELVLSDGTCWSASYMDGGVRRKRISFDPAKWELLEVPGADEDQARAWFEAHDGAGYDLGGNLKFVWGWWPHSKSRWFCTEAIAAALQLPGKPHWYGPRKLAEIAPTAFRAGTFGGGPRPTNPV
jgi:hypothetical protein